MIAAADAIIMASFGIQSAAVRRCWRRYAKTDQDQKTHTAQCNLLNSGRRTAR
jgi:hypothetical protein